jgi:Raf kinase inhibitor-like YbhB/YbcL family protein
MKHLFSLVAIVVFSGGIASAADSFELTSNLKPGQAIPADYYANAFGCNAKSTSPTLEWKNAPAGTKSFAVTFYDKDAPTGSGFWHYVLFDIPADVHKIETGDLTAGKTPKGAVESMTDAGKPGYFGPCPPVGRKHTYIYTVYALKTDKLGVPPNSTPAYVGFNLWGNTLAKASFTVTAGPRKN